MRHGSPEGLSPVFECWIEASTSYSEVDLTWAHWPRSPPHLWRKLDQARASSVRHLACFGAILLPESLLSAS